MLEIRNLTIRSAQRVIVSELSFHLPARGITALIGPSGCGKTSVLKWLAGVLSKDLRATGDLRLAGAALPSTPRAFAYQPQSDALFPWLTLSENAGLGLELAGLSRRAAMAKVRPLLPDFGLAGLGQSFPDQLSGGQRQRAAFLRSMLQTAPFLLLDEPFSALDAVTRLKMQSWLLARLEDHARSVLLVTHDLHEAVALADQILVMQAGSGKILAEIPISLPPATRSEAAMAPLREDLKSLLLED